MGTSQQFSLRWNNYLSHIIGAFDSLRSDEDLVDVTLSCEGKRIRAHKMLLSACSTYFRDLFKENPCQHPVVIFRNVKFEDLVALVDFMYQGEVNVVQEQLGSFLTTAELLAVQGLSEGSAKDSQTDNNKEPECPDSPVAPPEPEVQMSNNTHGQKQKSTSSPVSFFPVDTSDSPSVKRRKWSSLSATVPKSSAVSVKKDSDGDRRSQPSPDPVEIIPVVQNLKMELPDYGDQEQDASSCSYSDSNQGGPPLSQMLPLSSASTSADGGKQEPPDLYSSSSRDATMPPSAESLAASDLSQILSKPGTSGETQAQDSLQGEDNARTPGYILVGDRFMCSLCQHTFNTLPILARHIAAKHQKQESVFSCTKCNRYFKTKWSLSTHNSRYHKNLSFCGNDSSSIP
ncbi:protein bric-a-brac 2 isoform X2 [Anabrus simplex]|uniref:protein bric-a-brac 2 isoform X2 n=1 Tax=Anabrus simplex TaxID=316456 RepID=UPI0034DD0E56